MRFARFTLPAADGNEIDLAGNQVPGVPGRSLSGILTYKTHSGFRLILDMSWNDGFWVNDHNGPPDGEDHPSNYRADAATVWGLRLNYKWALRRAQLCLQAGIENLFDSSRFRCA